MTPAPAIDGPHTLHILCHACVEEYINATEHHTTPHMSRYGVHEGMWEGALVVLCCLHAGHSSCQENV